MKEYKASSGKELSKLTVYIAVAMGCVLIMLAFIQKSIYAAALGVVLIAAVSFSKSYMVTEEGVVTVHSSLFSKKKELLAWGEIMEIFVEYSDKHPNMLALHFTKESLMARRLLFQRNDAYEILELAEEKNPEIRIDEGDN